MRVHVSQGKHANYVSRRDCNEGGTFDSDTCVDVNTYVRDDLWASWHIGSRQHPLITCVVARNPQHEFYGSGRQECFWSPTTRFRGWYPTSEGGEDAGPYNTVLAQLGF